MFTTLKKRCISMILIASLVFTLFFSLSMDSFANELPNLDNKDTSIQVINNHKISIATRSGSGTITITKDNSSIREISVDSNTDGSFKLIYDKTKGTIYSTKTGNTIHIMATAPRPGQSKTVYISYAQIKAVVGEVSGWLGVASFIAMFFTGGTAKLVSQIITALGAYTFLQSKIAEGSPYHGIRVTSVYHTWQVTKGGQKYTLGDWKLKSLSTY